MLQAMTAVELCEAIIIDHSSGVLIGIHNIFAPTMYNLKLIFIVSDILL